MHQRLVIVQNGRRAESVRWEPLRHGADGNEQTLRYAAQMVREDSAADERIRAVAASPIAQCAPHDAACEISQLFEFVRDQVRYQEDAPDTERIADAWRTLEHMAGDCGDKSILLATLLGSLGHRTQFIVQSWDGDLSDGYDHVHLELVDGPLAGVELDPTNEHAPVGWEARDAARARFEIWESAGVRSQGPGKRTGMDWQLSTPAPDSRLPAPGLSGFFDDFGGPLISTGIQVGSQFASSAAQQSKLSAEQGKAIGAQFENLASQALQVFQAISAKMPYVTADDVAVAQQAYQAVESFVGQYPTEYVTTQWNSAAYKGAAQKDLAKFAAAAQQASQGTGAGSQGPGTNNALSFNPQSLGSSLNGWTIAVVAFVAIVFLKMK